VQVLEPLGLQPYGETEFAIKDPNGYALVFAERVVGEIRDASRAPRPASE
jgi:hypothetical protein